MFADKSRSADKGSEQGKLPSTDPAVQFFLDRKMKRERTLDYTQWYFRSNLG